MKFDLRVYQRGESMNLHKENSYRHKWRYADEDRPVGQCYDCRMMYAEFPDLVILDDLWEMINPTYHEGCGLLCPTCIADRLSYIAPITVMS